jgi:[ribosomal protein S5]-alanine N-acetyltransferase
MILCTERTLVRRLEQSDAASVLQVFSDPRAMAFAPMEVTEDLAAASQFIAWQQECEASHGFSAWAVVLRNSGEYVGHAGFVPHPVGVELIYAFATRYWGLGLATEVASACLRYGFRHFGFKRAISMIHPKNRAAIRVAEKLGGEQNGSVQMWERENLLYEFRSATSNLA